jgi:hypothetical protein
MRTWTKGTGATVEPEGADDRPRSRARPGGLSSPLPGRPWQSTPRHPRQAAPLPGPRVSGDARRRHALGYLDPATVQQLEGLEAELRGDDAAASGEPG